MTSHTETTSKVTETINSIDYSTGWQYSVSGNNVSNNGQKLNPVSTQNTVTVTPMGGVEGQVTSTQTSADLGNANFTITNPGAAFPVHSNLFGSGNDKPDRNPEGNRGYKRNGYYKYLYPVIGLLIASPVNAENVGGISATANPIANSSKRDQPGNSGITRSLYHQHLRKRNQLSRSHSECNSIHHKRS